MISPVSNVLDLDILNNTDSHYDVWKSRFGTRDLYDHVLKTVPSLIQNLILKSEHYTDKGSFLKQHWGEIN